MRILLIAPKKIPSTPRLDYSYWNFYIPLAELGHTVEFFDTTLYGNRKLRNKIDCFKPDLLFCIMTGAPMSVTPEEPWEVLEEETRKGNIKTFNWFCDDSYRFDSFTKNVCKKFHWCSTPEKKYIEDYKSIGYNNVVYSTWHANASLYSSFSTSAKTCDKVFVGGMHADRHKSLETLKNLGHDVVAYAGKVSFEDMLYMYSTSNICLNFTKDASNFQTQMKARIFEIIATGSVLLTEYTEDISNCFESDEILTFTTLEEAASMMDAITRDPLSVEETRCKGYERFIREHDSKVRLKKLLEDIR
tara:strand:- start:964 stop:1872 length:909 start_codon:yes stop_codon:yes gene_type:complete